MLDKIRGIPQSTIPLAIQQVQGVQPRAQQPIDASNPFLGKAISALSQKSGAHQPLDLGAFSGAREKMVNGRSLLPEGALGAEGAVNGKSGARMNFFA